MDEIDAPLQIMQCASCGAVRSDAALTTDTGGILAT
jgi:hypothetical protein